MFILNNTLEDCIMQEQELIHLTSLFNSRCSLDVYYVASMLLEQGRFNDFMQALRDQITQNINANDPSRYTNPQRVNRARHTRMAYENFMRKLNEILENGSLSEIEKLELALSKISLSLHVALRLLTREQCLLLNDLLEENRNLNQDQRVLIYDYLTAQTPEQDSLHESESQMRELRLAYLMRSFLPMFLVYALYTNREHTTPQLSGSFVNDQSAMSLNSLFVCECELYCYQLASILSIDQNMELEFVLNVDNRINYNLRSSVYVIGAIGAGTVNANRRFRIIFDAVLGNISLSHKERIQLILSAIPFSAHIAICMLTLDQRSLLNDLFRTNRTLSEAQRKQKYLQTASPSEKFIRFAEHIRNLGCNQKNDMFFFELIMLLACVSAMATRTQLSEINTVMRDAPGDMTIQDAPPHTVHSITDTITQTHTATNDLVAHATTQIAETDDSQTPETNNSEMSESETNDFRIPGMPGILNFSVPPISPMRGMNDLQMPETDDSEMPESETDDEISEINEPHQSQTQHDDI
jgi:hypothetical protein